MTWFSETLYSDWAQTFRVLREIDHVESPFQDIRVIETASHGRVLLLDGCVQITEADEFVYQEMIVHVALIQHGQAERVLIIGAGDGGVLRRVLQHGSVKQAVMVEIDGEVIRLVQRHMPNIAGDAWHDPRAEIIIGDGVAYLAGAADASFDVIIVDSTDPAGVGAVLFTETFYRDCARVLSPAGLIVSQSGVPFMQSEELQRTNLLRARCLSHSSVFVVAVPTYVGGFMALGIAGNGELRLLSEQEAGRRAERSGIVGRTDYWSPGIHTACFKLPPYIERLLAQDPQTPPYSRPCSSRSGERS